MSGALRNPSFTGTVKAGSGGWKMGEALKFSGAMTMIRGSVITEPVDAIALTDTKDGAYGSVCFGGFVPIVITETSVAGEGFNLHTDGTFRKGGNAADKPAPVVALEAKTVSSNKRTVCSAFFVPGRVVKYS